MFTPYDWQESIGNRSQYVESRLATGTPVIAISLEAGILGFTVRRQAHKLFEIYERLMYGAIGQQSDVEAVRVAAIDFAHQEGFQRSEQDVTIQRVVGALSQPLKRAFGDFASAPFVLRALFAEVAEACEQDKLYILEYDGDFSVRKNYAYLAGTDEGAAALRDGLSSLKVKSLSPEGAMEALKPVWAAAVSGENAKTFDQLTESLFLEVALLERSPAGERRFKLLTPEPD